MHSRVHLELRKEYSPPQRLIWFEFGFMEFFFLLSQSWSANVPSYSPSFSSFAKSLWKISRRYWVALITVCTIVFHEGATQSHGKKEPRQFSFVSAPQQDPSFSLLNSLVCCLLWCHKRGCMNKPIVCHICMKSDGGALRNQWRFFSPTFPGCLKNSSGRTRLVWTPSTIRQCHPVRITLLEAKENHRRQQQRTP